MSATCVENSSTNSCANPRGESSTAKETFKRSFPREIDIEKAHLKHARHVFVTHDDALKFPMRPPVHSELPRPASTPPRARVSRSVYPKIQQKNLRRTRLKISNIHTPRPMGHDRPRVRPTEFPGGRNGASTDRPPRRRGSPPLDRRVVVASSSSSRARAPEFKRRLRHAQRPRGGVRRE